MFYAHFVLAKKGPLARIWLAAHWDKKLTKAHVFETNIESSVEGILQPKVKMALRTSGHLLLGIVRIYSRKAKYLLADCNEAFIKIKMAFRPGVVDLPEGNREAAVATITLPEVFHDFDTTMPDITIDMDAQVTLNQSRAEDITLKEDYGTLSLMTDDGFGDMGFDDPEVARDATNIDEGFDHTSLLLCDRQKDKSNDAIQISNADALNSKQNATLDANLKDVFGSTDGLLDGDAGGLFEPAGLFDDAPLGDDAIDNGDLVDNHQIPDNQINRAEDSDDDMYDMGPASMGAPSPPSSPESPNMADKDLSKMNAGTHLNGMTERIGDSAAVSSGIENNLAQNEMTKRSQFALDAALVPNEEETFALAPLDATIMQGTERTVKTKRKRKLIVDEVKNISGEEMKSQLSDTTDIVTTLDLAPPTKRLMHWKETGGVEKLFALPGHPILSKTLSRMYQRHLTTRSVENEELGHDGERIDLDAEQPKDIDQFRDDEMHAPKRRREMDQGLHHDYSHLDNMHLGTPQAPPDPFAQQHMFQNIPDAQMMSPMMQPQPHMMHQPLPADTNSLSHLVSPMLDPHSMMPRMHDMPQVSDPFSGHSSVMDAMSQHLLSDSSNAYPEKMMKPDSVNDNSHPSMLNQTLTQPLTHLDKDLASNSVNGQVVDNSADMAGPSNVPCFLDELSNHTVSTAGGSQFLRHADELQMSGYPFAPSTSSATNDLFDKSNALNVNHVEGSKFQTVNEISSVQKLLESDDDDDYGAPSSVGPSYAEEQMADETYEQFEERILTKRTTHMLHIIHNEMENDRNVKFTSLLQHNKRKQVAQKFYTFLVLKKQQAIDLHQDDPYGEIVISKGPKFDTVYNSN